MSPKKQKSDPENGKWVTPKANIRLDLRNMRIHSITNECGEEGYCSVVVFESLDVRLGLKTWSPAQCDEAQKAFAMARKEHLDHRHLMEAERDKEAIGHLRVPEWNGQERREPEERRTKERGGRERRKPGWLAKLLDRD